jgi:hypothetical protein
MRNIQEEYKPEISHILTSTSSTFFKEVSYSLSIETKFGKGSPSDLTSDLENGALSTLQFKKKRDSLKLVNAIKSRPTRCNR